MSADARTEQRAQIVETWPADKQAVMHYFLGMAELEVHLLFDARADELALQEPFSRNVWPLFHLARAMMVGSGQMHQFNDANVERIFKIAEQNCLSIASSAEWIMPESDPVPLVDVSKFHPSLKPLQPAGQACTITIDTDWLGTSQISPLTTPTGIKASITYAAYSQRADCRGHRH